MTDRYEKIRQALEMGPTPGDWDADFALAIRNGSPAIVEYFVRRYGDDISIAADIVNPSSGLPSSVNANYIAACDPDTIRALLEERDALLAERDRLKEALEAMLEIHGVTQRYADAHIEIPQSWVDVSDLARAALAQEQENKS